MMAWGKLDDGYHGHRKIRRAGLAAVGVHAMAISYSSAYGLDGFVDVDWIAQVIPDADERRAILERLLRLRLFEEVTRGEVRDVKNRAGVTVRVGPFEDDGYLLHDFLAYNPSAAEVSAERESRSKAGKMGAAKRWKSDSSPNGKSHNTSHGKSNGSHMPRPDPSRPVPDNDPLLTNDHAEEPEELEVDVTRCDDCGQTVGDDLMCGCTGVMS
jgi:hypothetical protein